MGFHNMFGKMLLVAEYSAIEQALSTWWISNKAKPLYWKIDQLQAGFEELNIGSFFRNMLERHPQMDPSYHEIGTRQVQEPIPFHLVILL